jgi:NodT family efflux transporter outer membrane factor (OMF) lipoprotein
MTAAAMGFAFLAACAAVGPNYVRPTAAIEGNYKEIDGWKVAQPQDNTLRGSWWEIFNEPELNAFVSQVNISNQTVAAAEAQFRQARSLVQQARANFFPTVTVGVGITNSSVSTEIARSKNPRFSSTLYSMPVNVSWEIDVWGRIRRLVESSQAGAQASAADLETAQLSAQAELAQDYFQLRAVDAQRRVLDENVAAFQKSLELTNNRYTSGVASRADIVLSETLLKTTQA